MGSPWVSRGWAGGWGAGCSDIHSTCRDATMVLPAAASLHVWAATGASCHHL
jgi:hypothetical protein